MIDITEYSLEQLLDLLRNGEDGLPQLSEMDYDEVQQEVEYRLRDEDDGDSFLEEQYENAYFEGADEFYGDFGGEEW